jgi:hypothetical protein
MCPQVLRLLCMQHPDCLVSSSRTPQNCLVSSSHSRTRNRKAHLVDLRRLRRRGQGDVDVHVLQVERRVALVLDVDVRVACGAVRERYAWGRCRRVAAAETKRDREILVHAEC